MCMDKKQNWIIIVCFLLLIFGFAAASLLKPETEFSEKENRELARMPKLDLKEVLSGEFSRDYEEYLSDQFVLRDRWIGVKTLAERALGKQEVNDIYFAGDHYLIETHRGIFETEQARQNLTWLSAFVKTQQEALGEEHVRVLLAPNAVSVLSEKLPPFAPDGEEDAYLDAAAAALPEGSLVDVRETLRAHAEEYLYYRTDHHWTTLGAWYAYEAWAREIGLAAAKKESYQREVLSEDFYGTVDAKVNTETVPDTIEAWIPQPETAYTVRDNHSEESRSSLFDLSCLEKRDQYAVFFGGNQPLVEISTEADSARRLLVIKDSYAHCFVPFAIPEFAQISMIDMRYFNERLSEYIQAGGFTDILFLYNAAGFAEDVSLAKLAL